MLKETDIPCTCRDTWHCNFCRELYRRPREYDSQSIDHNHTWLHVTCFDCKLYRDAIFEDVLRVYYGELPIYLGLFMAFFTMPYLRGRLLPLFRKGELKFCEEMFDSLTTYLSMHGCEIHRSH